LSALVGYKLAVLSNGSPAMLDALVKASGIAPLLVDVISVDRAKTYKPDPKCYELVVPALGVTKQEVLFVSSNGFDAAGAKRFGFKVAWIERGHGSPVPQNSNVGPAEFYKLLRGRAEGLGHQADIRINALTDLTRVVSSFDA
jgi:2-haloacid dehalogenase